MDHVLRADELVEAIEQVGPTRRIALSKVDGETILEGAGDPSWEWPAR